MRSDCSTGFLQTSTDHGGQCRVSSFVDHLTFLFLGAAVAAHLLVDHTETVTFTLVSERSVAYAAVEAVLVEVLLHVVQDEAIFLPQRVVAAGAVMPCIGPEGLIA